MQIGNTLRRLVPLVNSQAEILNSVGGREQTPPRHLASRFTTPAEFGFLAYCY
jgi:hypothetical protein